MNRIDALFDRDRNQGRRALMPFLTAGDPDLKTTEDLIPRLVASGADLIELGIPYSDPIADGPVISASYDRALRNRITTEQIFSMVGRLREHDEPQVASTPMVTMVSFAIVHRVGIEAYLDQAVRVGIDGLIVPDLPVEESRDLADQTTARNLRLIQLVTPTTPRDRAVEIAKTTTGFLYYVSVVGLTGERKELPPDLNENVGWLRHQTDLPICIGFGISGPEAIRRLAPVADGFIVGSAIVRRLGAIASRRRDEVLDEIEAFVNELSEARSGVSSASETASTRVGT